MPVVYRPTVGVSGRILPATEARYSTAALRPMILSSDHLLPQAKLWYPATFGPARHWERRIGLLASHQQFTRYSSGYIKFKAIGRLSVGCLSPLTGQRPASALGHAFKEVLPERESQDPSTATLFPVTTSVAHLLLRQSFFSLHAGSLNEGI
jgi:hypothetical protein